MKLLAHIYILSKSFLTIFSVLLAALAIVVSIYCFLIWNIPSIPSIAIILMTFRALVAISSFIMIAYSFSNDYKQSILEFLSR